MLILFTQLLEVGLKPGLSEWGTCSNYHAFPSPCSGGENGIKELKMFGKIMPWASEEILSVDTNHWSLTGNSYFPDFACLFFILQRTTVGQIPHQHQIKAKEGHLISHRHLAA